MTEFCFQRRRPSFLSKPRTKQRSGNCRGLHAGLLCVLLWLSGSRAWPQEASTFFELAHRLPMATRVLMIGAHPDDENSALLAELSRSEFVHCAYLSATRGEGGQDLIGPELFDALGIMRTEELLASRRFDHCEQFFTRAYDFGFSKDPQEAFEKWGREAILGDLVRVIRRYRPNILISVFRGVKEDGHGHHQAIGILTPEAVKAASDPSRFPEQMMQGLHPWSVPRLYVLVRDSREPGSFSFDIGRFSLSLGESLTEVAASGRSQHQSQGQGAERRVGPLPVYLKLIGAPAPPTKTPPASTSSNPSTQPSAGSREDFVAVLHTRLTKWTELAGDEIGRVPFLTGELAAIDTLAQAVANNTDEQLATSTVPYLSQAIQALRSLRQKISASPLGEERQIDLVERLRAKEEDFSNALSAVLGLSFDVRANDPTAVAGGAVAITATVLNRSAVRIEPVSIEARPRTGWTMKKIAGDAKALGYNESIRWKFFLTVPKDAAPTEMYWLLLPREGDRYNVANSALVGRAENLPELSFIATYRLAGDVSNTVFEIERPLESVSLDPRYGERRESFKLVPPVSVTISPDHLIVPDSKTTTVKEVFVQVASQSTDTMDGTVKLLLPPGWSSAPIAVAFSTSMQGEVVTKKFLVRIPGDAVRGLQTIHAIAVVGEQNYSRGFQKISYPHIHSQNLYRSAATATQVLDLRLPPKLKVGYVMGTGDRVPEALEQMGIEVMPLDERALAVGSLSGFDAIVTGIRAYDVRRDLVQNNGRLLEYVRQGGTLIVQYNSASFGVRPSRAAGSVEDSPQGVGTFVPDRALQDQLKETDGPVAEEKLLPLVDPARQFGPYPMLRGVLTDRVVDETASVRLLAPQDPVFTFPNTISEKDFEGWVQERGLYFMKAWDDRYTALMASHDPGERDQLGGTLMARYGKGNFVMTGYAWFRQLPAGVPGAYRIFANLVSLSRATKKNP
jgi:LmbE family N-acetylglucosaminyl deacetylase